MKLEPVDVVIPALNESETVGSVVSTFRAGRNIGHVYVVSDLSRDRTSTLARKAGATVVKGPGLGKGQAMMRGLREVKTPRVIFADADLHGLTPAHVDALAFPTSSHIVGFRDLGKLNLGTVLTKLPPIAGERSLPTKLVRELKLTGFGAETQINAAVARAGINSYHFIMRGVTGTVRSGPARLFDVAPFALQAFPELIRYPRQVRWLKPV
jgi:glycosyltransferase involved in cell wall biosynthesis